MTCIEPRRVGIDILGDSRGSMSEITLNIDGMHCGACVRRVTQTLERIPGTEVVEVRIGAARVKTENAAQAVTALATVGYTARPDSF